jgi:protein SCO1/2
MPRGPRQPRTTWRGRRGWIAGIAIAVLLSGCGGGVSSGDLLGVEVNPPQPKPSFTLNDTDGNPFNFRTDTEGKLALLYFGYINCPDICPVHLAQLAEVFDQIPPVAHDTMVIFVSIDPDRDTPDKIRAYLDNFDSRFIGLTGTLEEVQGVQEIAGVPAAQFIGDDEDYTVNHAAAVFAFAPDGLMYSLYPFGTRQSQWKNDLPLLVEIKEATTE